MAVFYTSSEILIGICHYTKRDARCYSSWYTMLVCANNPLFAVLLWLFAEQLKYGLREKCPKIVRVYSEMLENQVFPIPRDYVVSNVRGRK